MPVHGEYRHLSLHARLAEAVGIPKANTFVMEDGNILELNANSARIVGKINAGHVYVDGLSVGDVGNVVLHDRRIISRDGMAVVVITIGQTSGLLIGRPEIVSRGFVDSNEARDLIEESRDFLVKRLNPDVDFTDWGLVSAVIKETLGNFFYEKIRRKPIIIPVLKKV